MKIKNLLLALFIISIGMLKSTDLSASKINAISMSKLAKLEQYVKSNNSISNLLQNKEIVQYPFSVQNDCLYVNLLVKAAANSELDVLLHELGARILSRTKTIYFVKAPIDAINRIVDSDQVLKVELSQKIKISLDESKKSINAEQVIKNTDNQTELIGGEGVLVGVVDTGIDFTHPDFHGENGTRILKLWDMSGTEASGPEGYENYDWGKEYTKSDIDNSPEEVKEIDKVGHGTHVAGIAAGGGNHNLAFRGVAYNSDILFVKVMRSDEKESFTDGDIIAACDYIVEEAKKLNRPVVINLSLGGILGSHDGKSLLSLAISELSAPGVLFSIAAGNSGELPIHAGGHVDAGTIAEFPILAQNLCEMMEDIGEICDRPNAFLTAADIWHTGDIIDSVYLVAYDFMSIIMGNMQMSAKHAFPIDTTITSYPVTDGLGAVLAYIDYSSVLSDNYSKNSGNLSFFIHNDADPNIVINKYIWSIAIKTKKEGDIDMWAGIPILEQMPIKGLLGEITFSGNNKMLVGSPADADSAISVGSFATKNSWIDMFGTPQQLDYSVGAASSFSSPGPSRDGRTIPLISAPGQIIFAAKSKDYKIDEENVLEGEKYCGLSGTSMAAPHVTGALALMLQINPKLSYSDIVEVFSKTAKKDNFTGAERNNIFGFGKLDLQAAIDYLVSNSGIEYIYANDVKVYPNPATNFINFELNSEIDINNFRFNIYNSAGEKISNTLKYEISGSSLKLDITELNSGVYNIECFDNINQSKKTVSKFRFVVK